MQQRLGLKPRRGLRFGRYEIWARQVLAPPGRRLHDVLRAKDIERSGTLASQVFQDTLQERR